MKENKRPNSFIPSVICRHHVDGGLKLCVTPAALPHHGVLFVWCVYIQITAELNASLEINENCLRRFQ